MTYKDLPVLVEEWEEILEQAANPQLETFERWLKEDLKEDQEEEETGE